MRLPIYFIFLTVVLDSMGIGIIMPVMPDLIREVGNIDLSQAAMWGGILTTAFAVNQFLFSPTLGSLSDAYGRRPVLLAALFVMALDYLVMGLAHAMWLLLIGRIVGGITAATQSTASAYMADISTDADKAKNFGILGAAFGVGFIFGPILGGLLSEFGSRAPFYAAATLALLNMLFGYFVLPETVTESMRRPFDWRRSNPFGAFRHMRKQRTILPIILVFFLLNLAVFVYPAVWAYFGRAQFGWDARMVGISLASYGFGMAIVQGFLIRPILAKLGETRTALLGMSIHVLSFFIYPFMSETWHVFAALPINVFSAICVPALQSMMSNRVTRDAQGELQGVLGSTVALATIFSPLIMTQTFRIFTSDDSPVYLPAAPFLLSALAVILAITVFQRWRVAHTPA
ncbi:tetracycline resistance MFS efflux pump [Chromatiales bacterium (ex Bugula neritina AB1)]|nr:tetracycline resistance MFS efflux pump [Chromatiales bacterium (ex Bugula neritina AB1)]